MLSIEFTNQSSIEKGRTTNTKCNEKICTNHTGSTNIQEETILKHVACEL